MLIYINLDKYMYDSATNIAEGFRCNLFVYEWWEILQVSQTHMCTHFFYKSRHQDSFSLTFTWSGLKIQRWNPRIQIQISIFSTLPSNRKKSHGLGVQNKYTVNKCKQDGQTMVLAIFNFY